MLSRIVRRRTVPSSRSKTKIPSSLSSSSSSLSFLVSSSSSSTVKKQPSSDATTHLLSFSTFQSTYPTYAKVQILSFGQNDNENNDNGNDDSERIDNGILSQILPVGSVVQKGDIIAMIETTTTTTTEQNAETNEQEQQPVVTKETNQIAVYAPQTGRILNTYVQVKNPVKIGDHLLELDDHAVLDVQAFQQHVQSTTNGQLSIEFMKTYLEKIDQDESYRLQNLVQHLPPQLQSQALPLYEHLLTLQTNDAKEQAKTRTQLGVAYYNRGDIQACLEQLQQALTLRQTSLGPNDPQTAATHVHIGSVCRQIGAFDESLHHMKAALEIQKNFLGGEEHPVVANSYTNIGALYYQLSDFHNAIQHYSTALSIHQKVNNNGEMTGDYAGTCHNLGIAWKHMGDIKTAMEFLEKALSIRQQLMVLDDESNDSVEEKDRERTTMNAASVADSHTALGQLYSEQGNYEAALEQYDAAETIHEQNFGKDSPAVGESYNNKGAVFYQQYNYDEALQWYQQGLDILKKSQPDQAYHAHNNVGMTYLKLGELDKSLEHHNEARTILTTQFGENHPNIASTLASIGNVYKAQGKFEMALQEYETAHTLLESAVGTNHPDVASSFNNRGLVLSELDGREEEALEMYRMARTSFEGSIGPQHPHVGSCLYNSGLMLQTLGRYDEAIEEFSKAKEVWKESLGEQHAHTATAQTSIDECKKLADSK